MTPTTRTRPSVAAVKPPRRPRVRLWTLVREEIRALPRNIFALVTIAAVLAVFAPLGAFAYMGESGVRDTLLFTWLVGELIVAIAVAVRVAGARRSRFVDSLYTTPLDQRTWFGAQAVVGCVLALVVVAVQIPFLIVHMAWLGLPPDLPVLMLAVVGMGAFAVALGLFCGVVVGDATPMAAAGLAGGLAFLTFALFITHLITLDFPPTPTTQVLLRITALSPLVLTVDAAGLGINSMTPVQPWRPIIGLVGLVAALGGAAWLAYTAAQTPLGWERRKSRHVVAALAAFAVLVPVATAETEFLESEGGAWPYYEPGEHTQVAFVVRDAPIHNKSFTISSIVYSPDLVAETEVELDALVLARVPDGATVRDVRIEIKGSHAVRVDGGGQLVVPNGEPHGYAPVGTGWETTDDGPPRPVYRVPVTLRVVSLVALGDSPVPVEVHTQLRVDGELLRSVARTELDGEVQGAIWQLIGAGLILPSTALAAVVVRKRRTR